MGFWQFDARMGADKATRSGGEEGRRRGGTGVLGQEVLLMLLLERSDPTRLVRISLGEMDQGALRRGGADALGWRVGSRKVGSEMGLIGQPAGEPAIRGGDRKGEVAQPPDAVQGLAFGGLAD